jgi:hypothetical protein
MPLVNKLACLIIAYDLGAFKLKKTENNKNYSKHETGNFTIERRQTPEATAANFDA